MKTIYIYYSIQKAINILSDYTLQIYILQFHKYKCCDLKYLTSYRIQEIRKAWNSTINDFKLGN
jgi:hypothetical protein